MAANTVRIEFIGDSSRLLRTMAGIRQDASRTSGVLGRTMGGIGRGAAVAARAVAGAGVAAAGGIGLAINKAAEFEKTMNQVAVSTDAPKADLKSLTNLALEMGAKTVFSAQDAGQAMLELSKGGLNAAIIKGGALSATMTLAAAGSLDMANAATYVSNALNTFGLKADQADEVTTALAGGANASTASVESLGMALSQVGPGAVTAGLSIQETVAALAAFDNAGIKGSDAGTSLKTMLTRLVPQTTKAEAWFRRLNVRFTDSQGNFVGLTEMAEQLKNGLDGLNDRSKTLALSAMFGSDATRAASVLAKNGAAGIEKMLVATNDQAKAQEMANASMTGAAGAMEAFKGSVETVAIKLGTILLPIFTKVTNWLANWLPGAVDTAVGVFKGWLPTIKSVVKVLGDKFGPVISALVGWFRDDIAPALAEVGRRLLPKLQSMFKSVGETIGKHKETFHDLGQILTKIVIPALGGIAGALIDIVGPAFAGVMFLIKNVVIPAIDVFIRIWLDLFDVIITGAAKAFGWIPGLGDKLRGAEERFDEFKDSVNATLDEIRDETVVVNIKTRGEIPSGVSVRQIADGRAHGGPIAAGRPYLVGEEGPELITPTRSGFVHNARDTARMGRGGIHIGQIIVQGKDAMEAVRSLPQRLEQRAWLAGWAAV